MLERADSPIAEATSPDEVQGRAPGGLGASGFIVTLNPLASEIPPECASCGALASSSRVARRASDDATIIVPYCDACHARTSAPGTQALSSGIASCLVAITLASALPAVFQRLPIALLVAIVILGALLTVVAGQTLSRSPRLGLSGVPRAVWWTASGELACTSEAWAAELARRNQCAIRRARLSEPKNRWLFAPGPLLGLLLVALFYPFYHPRVRILNLTPERLTIWVDGRPEADVEPTSTENPRAGVERRLPAGMRLLEARTPVGRVVSRVEVRVLGGGRHLYAPGSDGYCFWLESTAYGRSAPATENVTPLISEQRFWVIPEDVDSWFSPNPPPTADDHSTGGVLSALRQAPCQLAPVPGEPRAESGDGDRTR